MQLDATSLPVRDKDSPKGIVCGALWGYVGDATSVVYLYNSSGKKLGQRPEEIGPEEFLALRRNQGQLISGGWPSLDVFRRLDGSVGIAAAAFPGVGSARATSQERADPWTLPKCGGCLLVSQDARRPADGSTQQRAYAGFGGSSSKVGPHDFATAKVVADGHVGV